MRRLLQKSMTDYRNLTAAVTGMWDKLQPHILPEAAPAIGLLSANTAPVQFVEIMTASILETLDVYERQRRANTPPRAVAQRLIERPTTIRS